MAKVDDEFILANLGRMSQRQIAKHFGVSVSTVNRHVDKLVLKGKSTQLKSEAKRLKVVDFSTVKAMRESSTRPGRESARESSEDKNELDRLIELRDIVLTEIKRAQGMGEKVARLSKEYREILREIRMLEGSVDDGLGEFADLASSFQGGVPAANVATS